MAGGISLAATWNPALAERVGSQIGRDARAKGGHFLLGPGVIFIARQSTAVFKAAVKEAHVGAIMNSYNLTNGQHMSQKSTCSPTWSERNGASMAS